VALVPTANEISVREVLAKFEAAFATDANSVENGEFALWVGSGISRQAPNLGNLIERAFDYIRKRAIDPATAPAYLPALEEANLTTTTAVTSNSSDIVSAHGACLSHDDRLAEALLAAAAAEDDPLWRMPLWRPYRKMIDSKIADLNNVSEGPQGGAITAALYLQEFVEPGIPWAHLDVMAWNNRSRPGRPEGAEAQTLRALYAHIAGRFAAS
jgi:hypothetical protein